MGATTHRRPTRRTLASAGVLVLLLGALGLWAARQGGEALAAARTLSGGALAVALAVAVVGTAIAGLAWRAALEGFGVRLTPLPALRICSVGQLGKYLPGSLWPAVVQAELASRRGVARPLVIAAFAVSLGASVGAGSVVAALVLLAPTAPVSGSWPVVVAAVLAAGFLVVLARPGLILRVADTVLRRWVTLPDPGAVADRALRRCLLLSVLGWTVTGLHVWVLADAVGADPRAALPAAVGGLALATVAGSLVVLAPGGLGAREVVLVGALSTVLPIPAAAAVAAASRLLTLLAEVALAGATAIADRRGDDGVVPAHRLEGASL